MSTCFYIKPLPHNIYIYIYMIYYDLYKRKEKVSTFFFYEGEESAMRMVWNVWLANSGPTPTFSFLFLFFLFCSQFYLIRTTHKYCKCGDGNTALFLSWLDLLMDKANIINIKRQKEKHERSKIRIKPCNSNLVCLIWN